jgi:hypothetical protein
MSHSLFSISEIRALQLTITFGLSSEGLVAHIANEKPYFLSSMAQSSGIDMWPSLLGPMLGLIDEADQPQGPRSAPAPNILVELL